MVTLRDKFEGCIAASWVGSAMGAPVEGWPAQKIRETYGRLEWLLPYKHYTGYTDWLRLPGTTEDGIERQKLVATAIIEKGDRIQAHDLVAVWLRDLDPARMVYKQEPFDRSLLELARSGVPPSELGQLWPFPNVNSVARAFHPLGLINAGDPAGAADDTFAVGRILARETSFALRWAALYNAALAEACRPAATVESVLAAARRFARYRAEAGQLYALYDTVERDLDFGLDLAARHTDPAALGELFDGRYHGGEHFTYSMSQANEVVPKGLAIFAVTRGNPREAIVAAVNMGRDTDCLAAVAGGLAGALSGGGPIPAEWVAQVNDATLQDPYTNNRRTIQETAAGLLSAFVARRQRMTEYLQSMSDAIG